MTLIRTLARLALLYAGAMLGGFLLYVALIRSPLLGAISTGATPSPPWPPR
ncbi:MAG: hypothetical protein AB7E60_07430 [Sphingobium sp.]